MRLYISADIEGIAGITAREQLMPAGFDYAGARSLMTDELIAVIDGAREGGAREFVVSDSHGNGQSLLTERLAADVALIRGWPRPLLMMQGIESGRFDAAILLGYHSGAESWRGGLAHTLSTRGVLSLELNGVPANEATLSAATAGHFGVPVALVSGDDAFIEEVSTTLNPPVAVVTQYSVGTYSRRTITPAASRARLRAAAAKAIASLSGDRLQAFQLETPIRVELTVKYRQVAELLNYLDAFERTGPFTVRFVAADMVALNRMLAFVLFYKFDEH
jgi:D-amino peptidase